MPKNSLNPGRNEDLKIDRDNIWHPFTPLLGATQPIYITHGKGVYIYTDDGREIIDAIASWWVNLHGHGNTIIAEAIAAQAKALEHVIFAGFTHEPAIHFAKNLLSILPSNQSRIFFSDNGSTAVEVALKMSFQYWHNQGIIKNRVIAFKGAYHGDTFGSMSVGSRSPFTNAFERFLFSVDFIDVPTKENLAEVVKYFTELVSTGEVASFIFEPLVQAAGGMVMYDSAHLDALLSLAHRHGVVCIADEVFTGFGRTGKLFASDYLANKPDLMAVSKGITGGALPLGVTSCSKRIAQAFDSNEVTKTFFHGHSYTANPIACSAANASFDLLMAESCQTNLAEINQQHTAFIQRIKKYSCLADIRCMGTILAMELQTLEGTNYFNAARDHIYNYFLQRNILLRPLGNVFYILPPYVIQPTELEIVYTAIIDFLDALELRGFQ